MSAISFIRDIFIVSIFLSLSIADINKTNEMQAPTPTEKTENLPDAKTGSENAEGKNILDWEDYFKNEGKANTGNIGNMQQMIDKMGKGAATNPNISDLTNDNIKNNPLFSDNNAVKAWTPEMQENLMLSTFESSGSKTNSLHCYITRDISFSYKCDKTGVTYGGGMNESGKEALLHCRTDCYEQQSCSRVESYGDISTGLFSETKPDISAEIINTPTPTPYTISTNTEYALSDINFTAIYPETNLTIVVDMVFIDNKGHEQLYADDFILEKDANITIPLSGIFTSELKIFPKIKESTDEKINLTLSKININYKGGNKYICNALQDVSNMTPALFAEACPSGEVVSFSNGKKICVGAHKIGDNIDGTFSDIKSCEAACRVSGSCSPNFTTFNTELLKSFREGCIDDSGELGASSDRLTCDEECKNARELNNEILEEMVFDATGRGVMTVMQGSQVPEVDRPRIYFDQEIEYQKRLAEEWKDEAYEDMVKNRKYTLSDAIIGGNSAPSHAYGSKLNSGTEYGYYGTSSRTIEWRLKPNTYDVDTDKRVYMYAVIVAEVGFFGTNLWLEEELVRDRIYFIKRGESDYKPFAREEDIGRPEIREDGSTEYQVGDTGVRYKTFSSGSWGPLSSGTNAEYFLYTGFDTDDIDGFYWTYPVVENMGNIVYDLQGLVRKVSVSGLYETPVYDGYFDGTGEAVANWYIYVGYSPNRLTYAQLIDSIKNNDGIMTKIYEVNSPGNYPTEIKPDNSYNDDNIRVYQYGDKAKASGYIHLYPNEGDVGKKGYIYVFIK